MAPADDHFSISATADEIENVLERIVQARSLLAALLYGCDGMPRELIHSAIEGVRALLNEAERASAKAEEDLRLIARSQMCAA